MLLDGGLGDHQVGGDLPGRGRGDERLVRQRGPAQRRQDVEFPPGQLGAGRAAQLHLGGDVLLRDAAHPAAGGAEAEDIAVLEYPAGDQPPVNPGAVA